MSDTKPTKEERKECIKKLEDEAAEHGLNLSEYVAATGGDAMREILRRIIKTELDLQLTPPKLII